MGLHLVMATMGRRLGMGLHRTPMGHHQVLVSTGHHLPMGHQATGIRRILICLRHRAMGPLHTTTVHLHMDMIDTATHRRAIRLHITRRHTIHLQFMVCLRQVDTAHRRIQATDMADKLCTRHSAVCWCHLVAT